MLSVRAIPVPLLLLVAAAVTAGCGGGLGPRRSAAASEPQPRFRTPPGFTVETAAPGLLTGSIVAFTFDSFGRPVIARERGYPTLLLDNNKDGVYETERILTTRVNTLQGLWFDGRTLYAVGNNEEGQCGLYRLDDTAAANNPPETLARFERQMGEHGPHEIRRGPDGAPTIMLGNHTGVPADLIDPASPLRNLKEWQLLERYMDARGHAAGIMAPGGTVVRWNEDRRNFTLIAGGFRNAYSHAYNAGGELFTFDSDMEWDVNLPWYRPVRTVHVIPGGDYGWRTGSGKAPAYYFDTLPPLREAGRGSPVGVEFYRHRVYPEAEYRGALFEGDWSRGRILVSRPVRSGAGYRLEQQSAAPRAFVHGEPLNVTDLEVGPDGFLYFSTGGRDTDGGLYRVRYTPPGGWLAAAWARVFGEDPAASTLEASPSKPSDAIRLARMPMPLSSWGHAALVREKDLLGGNVWGESIERLALDRQANAEDRVQALLLLQRLGPRPKPDLLAKLLAPANPAELRAAAVLVCGLQGGASNPRPKALAAAALKDPDALVRRRAAAALMRLGLSAEEGEEPVPAIVDDLYRLLADPDRLVRYAARLALERTSRDEWRPRVLSEPDPRAALEGMLALIRTQPPEAEFDDAAVVIERLAAMLSDPSPLARELRLDALRLWGIAAIEWPRQAGEAAVRKRISDAVLPQLAKATATDEPLLRELARVAAWAGQPEAVTALLAAMPSGEQDNQPLQIHLAYCLRAVKEGWTPETRDALVKWFQKAAEWRGGASFTGYLNLMFDSALDAASFTEDERALAWRRIPRFAPHSIEATPREKQRMEETGWKRAASLARTRGVAALSPEEILEFQVYNPATMKAQPEKGREIFEKECASCHRFGPAVGNDFGPDLTTLRSRFRRKDVMEAILWPSRTVSDQYAGIIVETKDGDSINGLLVREDAGALLLKTADQVQPVPVPKANVKGRRKSDKSIMPDGLLDAYGQGEIANLVAFLEGAPPEK